MVYVVNVPSMKAVSHGSRGGVKVSLKNSPAVFYNLRSAFLAGAFAARKMKAWPGFMTGPPGPRDADMAFTRDAPHSHQA